MNHRVSHSRLIVLLTFSAVVGSFLASTWYAEYRTGRAQAITREIADKESPSIAHLASARAELRDLQRVLNAHVLLAANGKPSPAEPIHRARGRLGEEMTAYFALPALPAEAALRTPLEVGIRRIDQLETRTLEAAASRQFELAEEMVEGALKEAVDAQADLTMAAIQVNAEAVRQSALGIEAERRHRFARVAALDALSVLLAIALALLASRNIARYEGLIRRRSDELEGFAERVAHDLLNPLSAIQLSVRTARGARNDGRTEESLARISRGVQRARSLIDDLLAFARAGAAPVPGSVTRAHEVVSSVVDDLRPLAAECGIVLQVDSADDSEVLCRGGVLASILSNLVKNAIKYMGDREIKRVQVRTDAAARVVRFEVEDSGPGISSDLHYKMFEPYVRADRSGQPGIGLGLATVRRLVEAHDGRYGVISEVGHGALFWVELPRADQGGNSRGQFSHALAADLR